MSREFVRRIILRTLWVLLVASPNSKTHVAQARGIFEDYKTNVRIINLLENREDLTVHCRSKDDDLGYHHIKYEQFWEWGFFPNLFGGTKFWCSFQWNGAFHWFDVYIPERDTRGKCALGGKQCDWAVYEKQPCLIYSHWYEDYCLPWKT